MAAAAATPTGPDEPRTKSDLGKVAKIQ